MNKNGICRKVIRKFKIIKYLFVIYRIINIKNYWNKLFDIIVFFIIKYLVRFYKRLDDCLFI